MDAKISLGITIAKALAGVYVPQAALAVSGLEAVIAAVAQFNQATGKAADYVPSAEELDAFIAERESKRIPGA